MAIEATDGTPMPPFGAERIWVRPEVRTLSAGAAELAVGAKDDGVDKS
jgi:hypothetical protein